MVNDKSPSLDSYPCKFYKATWEFVGPGMLQVYREVVQRQSLETYDKVLIGLVSKPTDLKLITNQHPIILLNVSYKI